jgi:superfamily II DNA/RNA helicase
MRFDELYLSDNILDALDDMRFEECTPIQERCIPEILDGHDVLGVAQTGTGKTAAYLLPILSLLDDGVCPRDAINCVVMSPTRELAQQIDQAMQGFAYYLDDVSSVAVYGGNDGNRYDQETRGLQLGADVIIATPGRFISHLNMGHADLSRVSFFVLDEADRMLDMGFSDDILLIAKHLPPTCQTVMFSATMPPKIEQLAKTLLKDPVEVKLAVSKPADKIIQTAYVCHESQKLGIMRHLFRQNELKRVIVFAGSKLKVREINRSLLHMHINCGEMHSDLDQSQRDDIMYKFKTGQIDVLVATDIVARGIDIDDIAIVINYDVPHDSEDYVHRIGRTARADRDGRAITLVRGREIGDFMQIEKFLGYAVEKMPLPEGLGEAPEYKPMGRVSGGRGTRHSGRRGSHGRGFGSGHHRNQGGGHREGEGGKRKSRKAKSGKKPE